MNTYYNYAILKKGEEYLALYTNPNTHFELGHYFDQGYVFLMYQNSYNANSAIALAKQSENSEIAKINAELNWLKQENNRLQQENNNLRNNSFNTPFRQHENHDPYVIFGIDNLATKEEIKKRFQKLSSSLHPDKGGSNYLMSLVNQAYEKLRN